MRGRIGLVLALCAAMLIVGCGGDKEIPDVSGVRSELRKLKVADERAICALSGAYQAHAITNEFYRGATDFYENARSNFNGWLEDFAYSVEEGSAPPADEDIWGQGIYWSGALSNAQSVAALARRLQELQQQQQPPPAPPSVQQIPYEQIQGVSGVAPGGHAAASALVTFPAARTTRVAQGGSSVEAYAAAGAALIKVVAPEIRAYLQDVEKADAETRKQRADALRAVMWPRYTDVQC